MKRSMILSALPVMAALWVACAGSDDRTGSDSAGAVHSVAVATVAYESALSVDEYMGTVTARNQAEVESRVQARVERIAVALGSRISPGTVLAELDRRELQARVDQAEAVYQQAARDLARYDSLFMRKVVTSQEYDVVKARATVAKASLDEASIMLSHTRITAPFAGTVTERRVDVGDLAVPGRPLFVLEQAGALQLVVNLAESQAMHVNVGDSLTVSVPTAGVVLRGRLEELSSGSDPVSRTVTAKVSLPNNDRLRPGQFGRLQLAADSEPSLVIPASAIVLRGQLELVLVATPENRASLRLVRIGRRLGERIEILAGLLEGERVITSAPSTLSDGDLLEVRQ